MLVETEAARLANTLEGAVGPDNVSRFPDLQIDGLNPNLLVTPGASAQTAECLEICSRSGASVIPAGRMTWLNCGNPVKSADVVLSLARMNQVVDYNPADLTIWAQAGIAMSDLDAITRAEKQWLPLDPPGRGTLGAVVACRSSGSLRFGYGTPREHVIGLRLAHVDGTESKSGGRVVKNVAGYDLNKLYVGSLGTLAAITEVILKLKPAPEATATAIIAMPKPEFVYPLVAAVMSSRLRPASLFVLNEEMFARIRLTGHSQDQPGPCATLVRFIESEAAVAYEVAALRELSRGGEHSFTIAEGGDSDLWTRITNIDNYGDVCLKVSVPVSRAGRAISLCEERFPGCPAAADMGLGVIRISIAAADLDIMELIGRIKRLRAGVESIGGTVFIERAPALIRLEADAWGDPGPAVNLMRSLKQAFDPHAILSPGRFVGGI